jgi:hypothetical protein
MSRGTKRRAAAKEAENKIKQQSTLEELMGWSESKEDSFEASFYALYDASDSEDAGSSSKKPKLDNNKPAAKESQKNPTNKQGAAANSKRNKKDTKAASNKEVADPALDTAEWDYDMMMESELEELMLSQSALEEERELKERELKERDDRRAARLVHSNRPMFLSRCLAWKLSRIADTSPIYSPMKACRLSFEPSSVAILVTRRTSPIYSPLVACHLSFAPSSVTILATRRT